jgi:hypothetical protein
MSGFCEVPLCIVAGWRSASEKTAEMQHVVAARHEFPQKASSTPPRARPRPIQRAALGAAPGFSVVAEPGAAPPRIERENSANGSSK